MIRDVWNMCSECGRFVGFQEMLSGHASHSLITPQSDLSEEHYETLCPQHNKPTEGKQDE